MLNPIKEADTINSKQKWNAKNTVSSNIVKAYLDLLLDVFLLTECKHWGLEEGTALTTSAILLRKH